MNSTLSRAYGRDVVFVPTSATFRFDPKVAMAKSTSHWDLFSYLATQGKFTINGRELDFWNGLRNTMLNGGAFKICAGNASAQLILNEINFISGKRFTIKGGNALTQMQGTVEGNSLSELIANLSMSRAVIVSDN